MSPRVLLSTALLICYYGASSQSIRGNVASKESSRSIGYATVNVFDLEGNLVANVLSDASGFFNVRLDTGTYNCEILYAGHKKVTKMIEVLADEEEDFSMETDEDSPYGDGLLSLPEPASERYLMDATSPSGVVGGSTSYSYHWSGKRLADSYFAALAGGKAGAALITCRDSWGTPLVTADSGSVGKLTAGEINDFSKWDLWGDLSAGELSDMREGWQFSPTDRYTVQVTSASGLPLANAIAELLLEDVSVYTSRTDNTGKAELWRSLAPDTSVNMRNAQIRVSYRGQTKTIRNAKPFTKRLNTVVFETDCAQSEKVDIAVVVDATGSMQDEIDYLKYDLNDVIYNSKEYSSKLNLQFANVFYRDLGDAYVTRSQDFTPILSESVTYISQHEADGGGDDPEAVQIALDTAINSLSWRDDTRAKILLLVLDAPPHGTPAIRKKMRRLATEAAEKGIRIVPVVGSGADKYTEYLMRCMALATNGTYIFLTDHSGVGNTHVEPSTDSYQVEVLNALLTRVIKSYTYMPDCQQQVADLGINLPDSAVTVTTTVDSVSTDSIGNAVRDTIETLAFDWKYYPNPSNGIVHIVASSEIAALYISDLSGKVVRIVRDIEPDVVARIDLGELASGLYLIRYPVGNQWISGQIALVRS